MATRDPFPGSVRWFQAFLRGRGLTFACAESCTGGLLAREMTRPGGSSEVFWGGVVSYANAAKTSLLGVPPTLLATHGAVSGPVAVAMVQGLVRVSGVPLAVSITGVAGPGGGTVDKPVGTVWFGLATVRDEGATSVAVGVRLEGDRPAIQTQAARLARVLAGLWWDSGNDLDSLRSLTDNDGKAVVLAFQPPLPFLSNSL